MGSLDIVVICFLICVVILFIYFLFWSIKDFSKKEKKIDEVKECFINKITPDEMKMVLLILSKDLNITPYEESVLTATIRFIDNNIPQS